MANGQVKGYSTWSTWDSLQKGESLHKTIISFTQQLQMLEFSGFYFSPLNATASGVRRDEYDTASFPQHLTSPPKSKCSHYNSGYLLQRSPQGAREGLKAHSSTTRVVLTARHQVADGWCVQRKAQGTVFPEKRKTSAMKLWFQWDPCSLTCTLAPWPHSHE